MAYQTKRKEKPQNIVAKFWNEFLFAREFEYETPLSPDEMADALSDIENQKHKAMLFSMSTMKYHFEYEREGDKAGHFIVELANRKGSWLAMQFSEGTITANQDTGLTIIQGRTRFSKQYYLMFLFLFSANFFTQSLNGQQFMQILWIVMILVFWYLMYHERNKLADRIDNLIMNAKSNHNSDRLVDDDQVNFYAENSQIQKEYLSS